MEFVSYPVWPSYFHMKSAWTTKYVNTENIVNYKSVPISPNSRIFVKFSKNFFLFMLYPEAKTIGGRQK